MYSKPKKRIPTYYYDSADNPHLFSSVGEKWRQHPSYFCLDHLVRLLHAPETTLTNVLSRVDEGHYRVFEEGTPYYFTDTLLLGQLESAVGAWRREIQTPIVRQLTPRPIPAVAKPLPPPEPEQPSQKTSTPPRQVAAIYYSPHSKVAVYVVGKNQLFDGQPLSEFFNDMMRQEDDHDYGVKKRGTYFTSQDGNFVLGIMLVVDPDVFRSSVELHAHIVNAEREKGFKSLVDQAYELLLPQRSQILPDNSPLGRKQFARRLVSHYRKHYASN